MIHNLLKGKKIVLASASPRRKELFKLMGLKYIQVSADVDESVFPQDHSNPRKFVLTQSSKKCKEIVSRMDHDCIVIAADTIVYHDKKILGKPYDEEEAEKFLRHLSGKTHQVYTGVTIFYKQNYISDVEKTYVTFKELSEKEIKEYIMTQEPIDKAGAYGIQGFGCQFVSKINGCYFNVMGFPINLFYNMLQNIKLKGQE